MNKLLKQSILALTATAGGVVTMLLRFWHLQTRNTKDAKMLLAQGHIAGILALCLTAAVLGLLLWYVLRLPRKASCEQPFPASSPAAAGVAAGVWGVGNSAVTFLQGQADKLMLLTGFVGIIAALALALAGFLRMRSGKPNVLTHSAVTVYLMLLLICQYRMWSAQPQLELYLYGLLATISLTVATYHRACFDGGMGSLRGYAFFRLAGIHLCLAAIPGSDFWVLYLASAIWCAGDLCPWTDSAEAEGR